MALLAWKLFKPASREVSAWRAVVRLLAVAVVVLGVFPSLAWAHAGLTSTSPAANARVAREPEVVSFTFGESVGIEGDAVRVFDRDGRRVDSGRAFHSGGMGSVVGARLRPGLPDGSYTATYRVVSAGTHTVTGGFVFAIGSRSAGGAATLGRSVAGGGSGGVSDTAFAAARAVQYAAIGIAVGLVVFLLLVWFPALERPGAGPDAWRAAWRRYLLRVRAVLLGCCVAGVVSALVGIMLQGAAARGIDFWHAIGPATVGDVLPTRFGVVWGFGFVAWLLLLIVLMGPLAGDWVAGIIPRLGTLGASARPATTGAADVALPSARSRWGLVAPVARGWVAGRIRRATLGTTGVALASARTRWRLTAIGVPLAVARVRGRATDRDRKRERTRPGIVSDAVFVAGLVALTAPMAALAREWAAGIIPQPATVDATAQPATVGATDLAPPSARTRWPLAAIGVPLAGLLLLPALAGHAAIQHPVWLFAPMNVIHVAAMAVLLGGLVGLLSGALSLPRANGDAAVGTRTLAVTLVRFSPIALGCVVVLIATGVVQALIEVSAWSQLVDTGYGRAILVKVAALSVLIALGARQWRRSIPAVRAALEAGAPPVGQSRSLVQTLGAQLAMLVVVLAAVGSLAGSAPAREQTGANATGNRTAQPATSAIGNGTAHNGVAHSGVAQSRVAAINAMNGTAMSSGTGSPVLSATVVGGARIDISVTPATVGQNSIALTLLDNRTNRLFTATKQLTVTATLPQRHIGPLNLSVHQTAPGRYVTAGAVLGTPGVWTLQITDRTSESDQSQGTVAVPIR